ncbi:L-threonylcarbamoyladenylate synthase [Chromatocurvus halotolerans]|uniref:tRNA threonylcarbamoyl adenosine modification protein (Sua5/YciO/YrdC/YwlC family) n=1 Tax=Chromatocurvus halotolerans TaxID=1132028 RepID=A0A4R2KTH4_9GAMM|nr:L-threonylcarbamoyladenylate synthase [Chromatocurvus halotolerans]TCO76132.1 tRNA threonylcarbamoyl adenosine modification protein (Sua5/YciO/YrdC/YwlC family) [Chromatocurvus halotolerans]
MSQFFQIHPDNPQARLVRQATDIIRNGGVVVYPTDSAYALGCQIGNKAALDRIRRIRRLDAGHNFTLVCRDLSELATFARVDNTVYRLIRNNTPGPYTFILRATSEVPRRLMHPKRKTVGLRVPENAIAQALLGDLGEPIMSVTLIMPDEDLPLIDPYDIRDILQHDVDLVIDGGYCGMEATTVIDLYDDVPVILRAGKGDTAPFSD